MSSVIFSNAQRIISAIFQWLQTSGQAKANNLILDTFSPGIDNATTAGEGFLVVPGNNNTSLTPTVNVTLGGIAYDAAGNRIYISSTDTALYNPANIIETTNDGIGNFISTPQSTGCANILLTQFSQNYLWIDYLATIDTTAFTTNEITNAKIFYKQTDGYSITVTQINVPPDANSIFLASINMTGGGAVASSNISQVGRSYMSIDPKMVPITTPFNNGSNRTPSYNQNTIYTLDAHIKSIGTGTGISPTNPHNMSLADLGVTALDTVNGRSQITDDNVIIAGTAVNSYPSTSAMALSINIVDPGSDSLNVYAMLSTEFVIVNGTAYSTSQIFGVVPANATIFFPAVSGFYYVYWDSVSMVFGVTTTNISSDATKLLLATVTYTVSYTPGYNHLSGLTDLRIIGNSTTYAAQRWTTAARPSNPYPGEFGFNITLGTLEYWNGSSWIQPLTPSTLPSALPVDNTTIDLNGSNQLEVKAGGIGTTQLAANAVTVRASVGASSSLILPNNADTTLISFPIVTTATSDLYMDFYTNYASNAASNTSLFTMYVDGSAVESITLADYNTGGAEELVSYAFHTLVFGVAAGSHTVNVHFNGVGHPAGLAEVRNRRLTAIAYMR